MIKPKKESRSENFTPIRLNYIFYNSFGLNLEYSFIVGNFAVMLRHRS